jgi:nucleoside-diphosphate-sugar epimerase
LAEAHENVVAYDVTSRIPNTILDMTGEDRERIRPFLGSIADLATLLRAITENTVTGVISLAVITEETADLMPSETFRVNVDGCTNVCEAARLMDLRRVVYFSTQGVYGFQKDLIPLGEDAKVDPSAGVYQLSKYVAELIGTQYAQQFGVSFVAVRPSFVFGPGQREMFPLNVILANAMRNESLNWPQGGDHPIDYSYVKDVAAGAIAAYNAKTPRYRVYNLTGGKLTTTQEIVYVAKKHFPAAPIEVGPGYFDRFGVWDMRKILTGSLDNSRIMSDMKFKHPYGFESGLNDFIAYLKKYPSESEHMYVATRQLTQLRI